MAGEFAVSEFARRLVDQFMPGGAKRAWVEAHVLICRSAALKPFATLDAWQEETLAFFRGENDGDDSLREALEVIAAYKMGMQR